MGKLSHILLAAALAATLAGCQKPKKPGGNAPPTQGATPIGPDREWSTDDIAADPEGYLKYAGSRIDAQVRDRRRRVESLQGRLNEVRQRQQALGDKVAADDNLGKRMQTAIRRADDEERWPVVVAGRNFDRSQAQAVVDEAARYADERRPLKKAYDDAVARLKAALAGLNKDVAELARLRERLELDTDRVRLSKGMKELEGLRQTATEIASFSKALSDQAADDPAIVLPSEPKSASKVDLEGMLK